METQAFSCWFPPDLEKELNGMPGSYLLQHRRYEREDRSITVAFKCLSPSALRMTATFLRERRLRYLIGLSVYDVARVLDAASQRWLDPSYEFRRQAVEQISIVTGFSSEMVEHSIDLEMKS